MGIQANLVKSSTNPADVKATNVMSEIAVQWKNLTEVKRVKFNKLAAKAKATHSKAMEVYNEKKKKGLTEAKPKSKKDKTKPKRAMSAYLYFGKEARPKVKTDLTDNGVAPKVTAVMTELAVRWAKCPAGKRKKYQALAAKAKEQYDKDIQTWKINKKSKQNDFVPAKKQDLHQKKHPKYQKHY